MNNQLLSYSELERAIDAIVNSIDVEYTNLVARYQRVSGEDQPDLTQYLGDFLSSHTVHTFFVLSNLEALASKIGEDVLCREFVLSLTDRTSALLAYDEFDLDQYERSIIESVCRNKVDMDSNNYSLLVGKINTAIYIDREALHTCLKDNFWVSVVFLASLNFHRSQLYLRYYGLDEKTTI